jgi:hypothetical protein
MTRRHRRVLAFQNDKACVDALERLLAQAANSPAIWLARGGIGSGEPNFLKTCAAGLCFLPGTCPY